MTGTVVQYNSRTSDKRVYTWHIEVETINNPRVADILKLIV